MNRLLSMLMLMLVTALVASGEPWAGDAGVLDSDSASQAPAESIVESLHDANLRRLAEEVLSRNPRIATLAAEARSVEQRAPQVRSLPDPMASLSLFLLEPQTRVGPQQASIGLSQRLPWFGKLKLKEQAALLDAIAARNRVESLRLELVTRIRTLSVELRYLDREQSIVAEDMTTLEHYEELARARYSSGAGIGQPVIKIQAEITKARTRLLGIAQRRATLVAEINALRDRPSDTTVILEKTAPDASDLPPYDALREEALARRPELIEAQARIDAAAVRVELSKKDARPDLTVGLTYGLVGRRDDNAGQLNPPEGNGNDILGLSAGINLPVWRARLVAAVEEATQQRLAAEEGLRAARTEIDGELADLARRLPLIQEQVALFDKILTVQAEESLRSAETAYASGTAGALDLLDAERVLLEVRIAAERSRTELAVATARLEGAAAAPRTTLDRIGSAS